ncbi:MAG: hypothetical protein JRH01_11680 [Deltaproteobacteria bacterium]|nr:hypothetical protein [Deltaproteobacteria bacterium]MBW2395353.1 hypothetical protein [Deltaproteobacteria bacterium]
MREPRNDLEAALGELAPILERDTVPEPSDALVAATLERASALLHAPVPVPTHAEIPVGFKRELAKLLAAVALPLVFVLAWNAFILLQLPGFLGAWLPESLAWALPAAYVLGAAGWLALVFGSLPVVAHRRAWLRHQEAL